MGDTGTLTIGDQTWQITDTQKAGDAFLHFVKGDGTPEQGAATVLAAALEESLEDADGDLIYFVDGRLAPRAASPEARTQELPPDVAALLRRGVS